MTDRHVIVFACLLGIVAIVALALALVAVLRGWTVTWERFAEMRADRDSWRNRSLRQDEIIMRQRETNALAVDAVVEPTKHD